MNAAEYRALLDQAIAALEAIVRSVIAREGVPVTDAQRVVVAQQLLRYVQHARNISFAASQQYLRTMEGVNFNLPAEPEQYGLGAPIEVLKRVARVQGVTEENRRDPLVARKSARAITRGLKKHAEQPAREAVQSVAEAANGGAWARVLTGANSCYFCAMMASRGPVYESKHEALTGKGTGVSVRGGVEVYVFHDGCDCIVVFVPNAKRNRDWEGRAEWLRLRGAWEECDDGGELRDDDDDRPTANVFRSWWERQVREEKTARYIPNSIAPTPGEVDRSDVPHVHQHEIDTADRLARRDHEVKFKPATGVGKTADATIDGEVWEFKAPTGASDDAIARNLRAAVKQSPRAVLDLTNSPIDIERAKQLVEHYGQRYNLAEVRVIRGDDVDWRWLP
ncbi:capsid maturation protease and MuF-like fusion protein [Mycobacterium phage MalagasyRose]|uniref:Capsid maturation protease and MuF-like fusion protein n=1 Tax=Mycobacterium phage MalagasyRose TaxID=2599870 RepID=A0A5J6TGH5_9CAUD|nr:capsid maturation protease and MuF-like fusion protein [Mycobacterium phage MalagasyRose]QFG08859.1 capsid maturation protease and MuF-like fusion protein [Mycobacterium phage MalagasyRose]